MPPAMCALLLLSGALLAQEDARVEELIRQLDDDSFEVRERAEKELVDLGERAAPLLRKTAQGPGQDEVKTRARAALRAIEFAAKARKFYLEPKLVTLRRPDEELGRVLAELERQTGIKIDGSAVDLRARVAVEAADAPILKVLDDLCRGQNDRTYEYREDGVAFRKSRHTSCPAAYEGPFRIRIVKLVQERTTDFKSETGQARLTLEADWQRYLKPSRKVEIELRKATDDKGGVLEVLDGVEADEGIVVIGGLRAVRDPVAGDEPAAPVFTLKGLSPGATRLSLQGIARFSFPLEKEDVVFDKPATGDSRPLGDLTVELKGRRSGRLWSVVFSRTPGRPESAVPDLDSRLDRDSLVALDEDGKEHKGVLSSGRNREGVSGPSLAEFYAVFPTLVDRAPKEIRFKFLSSVFVKTVPFRIEAVPLP